MQAVKPRGVVLFVHGHGAYLLHELLRVDVRGPSALSQPAGLPAAAASRQPLGVQAAPAPSAAWQAVLQRAPCCVAGGRACAVCGLAGHAPESSTLAWPAAAPALPAARQAGLQVAACCAAGAGPGAAVCALLGGRAQCARVLGVRRGPAGPGVLGGRARLCGALCGLCDGRAAVRRVRARPRACTMLAAAGSRHLVQPRTSCWLLAHGRCCLCLGSGCSKPVCELLSVTASFAVLALLGTQGAASHLGIYTLEARAAELVCSCVSMHAHAFMRKVVVPRVAMRAAAGPWQSAKWRALRTSRCSCAAARSAGASQ